MKGWVLGCVVVSVMLGGAASASGPVMPKQVCIYEHVDFVGAGRCYLIDPGTRHKLVPTLGGMNDRASSLHVGEGVMVLLFAHTYYGGGNVLFTKSAADLKTASDKFSSLIIRPKAAGEDWRQAIVSGGGFGVELREGEHGKVWNYPLPERLDEPEARYPNLGDMNDKATRVWLKGDVEVVLYEHTNFAGKSIKLPGVGSNLYIFDLSKYQFGKRASSLVVRSRSTQQQIMPGQIKLPPPPPPRSDSESDAQPHRAPPATPALVPQTAKTFEPATDMEQNTNRPGQDYRSFDLAAPDPKQCQNACLEDAKCKAWSYVKPGVQGPKARCWLKSGVPPPEPAPCCISGVKSQ